MFHLASLGMLVWCILCIRRECMDKAERESVASYALRIARIVSMSFPYSGSMNLPVSVCK